MPSQNITLNLSPVSIKASHWVLWKASHLSRGDAGWWNQGAKGACSDTHTHTHTFCTLKSVLWPFPPITHNRTSYTLYSHSFLILLAMITTYLHTVIPLAGKGGNFVHFFFSASPLYI